METTGEFKELGLLLEFAEQCSQPICRKRECILTILQILFSPEREASEVSGKGCRVFRDIFGFADYDRDLFILLYADIIR